MNKIYNFLKTHFIFKYTYYVLLFFIFFSTTINSLSWNNTFLFMNIFKNYHDELCMFFGAILLIKETLLLICELFNKNNKEFIKNLLYLFIVFIVYYATLKWLYGVYAIIIINARHFDFKNIMNVYFYGKLSSFIIWVFSYMFKFIEIPTFVDGYSFGMYHYNDTALNLSCLFYITWYLYLQNKRILSTIIASILAVSFVYPIQSRTPVIILALFIVLIWIKPLYDYLNKKITIICKLLVSFYPFLMFCLTLFMCCLIYKVGRFIEDPFISRFYEAIISYQNIGIPLTCREFNDSILKFVYDNTYVRLLFRYGIITLVLSEICLCCSAKKIYKKNNWGLIVLLVVVCTYGLMEYVMKGELLLLIMTIMLSNLTEKCC